MIPKQIGLNLVGYVSVLDMYEICSCQRSRMLLTGAAMILVHFIGVLYRDFHL